MTGIGFSDHAPLPFNNNFAMASRRLDEYSKAIDDLAQARSGDIHIWKGLEIDYIPGMIHPNQSDFERLRLDYIIGAVHYVEAYKNGIPWNVDGSTFGFEKGVHEVFNGNIRDAVTRYFDLQCDMISKYQPTILAHMDRIKRHNYHFSFFDDREQWYLDAAERVLDSMSHHKTILEVNTKGHYANNEPEFYPSRTILEMAFHKDIPVHPAADAHHPEHLTTSFEKAMELLSDIGYTSIIQFDGRQWRPEPLLTMSY